MEQQTQQNCVPTGPPIEVVQNCIPPPQYGTLYPPIPSLQQMQRLKECVQSLTQNQGVIPESSLPGLTILGQPHSLLNLQGKNGSNDAPQLINSQVTYFAPTYTTTEHREFINCCEDCCEDICENCCLNCCLDCSKITQLLTLNLNININVYSLSLCFAIESNKARKSEQLKNPIRPYSSPSIN